MKFYVGDRVKSLVDESRRGGISSEDVGTVVGYYGHSQGIVCVEWDRRLKYGHTCEGKARDFHGWNVREDAILLIDEGEIDPIDLSLII